MSKKKNICLFTISLAEGGAEKSTAILSDMLQAKGHNVHIVSLTDNIKYNYSGNLFNFGQFKGKNILKKTNGFIKLRQYIKEQNFDVIIDNRTHQIAFREMFYMYYLYQNIPFIYVIHSYNLNIYFPRLKMVSKLMIEKAAKIVCVSKGIEEAIFLKYRTKNIKTIYNPIEDVKPEPTNNLDKKGYILFLGRLVDNVKNISLLLDAYNASKIRNTIMLKIFGDGEDKTLLQNKIDNLNISNFVKIHPFTKDVAQQISNARFVVLTSHFEGFPRVLIESLSLGVPVVSVNCSGSDEIVIHEKNGLLVPNYNEVDLARAMDRMFNDEQLYIACKNNAIKSVSHLHSSKIGLDWDTLLQSINNKNI